MSDMKFGCIWLKSGRAVIGIPGSFLLILAGISCGMGCAGMREWVGVFVLVSLLSSAESLVHRPRPKTISRRRSETAVVSVCQERAPKIYREAFVTVETSLGSPACFRVSFAHSWIGRPGSPVKKASANVRECPGLSRRLLKRARRHHWSFWFQEGFLKSHIGNLLMLRLCPYVRAFAPGCQVMSSSPSLGHTFSSLEPVGQKGVLTGDFFVVAGALMRFASRRLGLRSSCIQKPNYVFFVLANFTSCVVANFNRGCPSVRRFGNAHRGRMMSKVVSVWMMNVNAPVFIVNVTRGGRLVQLSSPIVLVAPASVVRWRGVLSKSIDMLVCRLRRLR
ncbi:hypothetical protein CRG98_008480 [Punica granatum]|uniref:Uncharacterized protein n=1 Tax=Punica granatum TaxID=22663 RepID=A0A2I0KRK2_PUNGR|nr:hypothetical protein CRG98_008480 [Punica granatum]